MAEILAMPKLDVHRHLTGSITADVAIRVAATHNLALPTYISRDLTRELFPKDHVDSHAEYFVPWRLLNNLFSSTAALRDLILNAIASAALDNVVYLELRLGPRGISEDATYSFQEFAKCVAQAVADGSERNGIVTKCILGIPRHVFTRLTPEKRRRVLAEMLDVIQRYPNCFVGVDLNGDEETASGREFEAFFKMAKVRGLGVTIHAGEVSRESQEILIAVTELGAARIGHGIAAGGDQNALSLLHEKQVCLEVCPTSNEMLGVVASIDRLPLRAFWENDVPFIICTDNPARCGTSLSEELYKVAKAFSLSGGDLRGMSVNATNHIFADEHTKRRIRAKMQGS